MKIFATHTKRKLREWIARYLPAEIAGTLTALGSFWFAHQMTDSLAIAAIAGTVGENVGYYSIFVYRELSHAWKLHASYHRLRRAWMTSVRMLRNVGMEFGVAELLDSFAVRPLHILYVTPAIYRPYGLGTPGSQITGRLVLLCVCHSWLRAT